MLILDMIQLQQLSKEQEFFSWFGVQSLGNTKATI
jgi:hypothetical protein